MSFSAGFRSLASARARENVKRLIRPCRIPIRRPPLANSAAQANSNAEAPVRPPRASANPWQRTHRWIPTARDAGGVWGGDVVGAGVRAAHVKVELEPGALVVVALTDSSKAPRRLALVKGLSQGGSHVLLHLPEEGRQVRAVPYG